jgi:hypothetical protein
MVITRKLAHKVQNDLTSILGYIEVALQELSLGHIEKAVSVLTKAKQFIHVLSHMLNNRIIEDEQLKEKE